ncbi:bifunctional [glutamine synthetase] adenylyltransferase/[glutamine synthetase]-adenylyl-L-tyrosine phosphorylase [Thalassospiraceae bacterium LMO-JJ14]|nr:bifunctional [glutamine synthetase] adenylyltransferase/[glutamine synthetase]-adenylyl-L-tyrosine phosphorylase [Thalassospiraceae bacterium LMO-JJ14]
MSNDFVIDTAGLAVAADSEAAQRGLADFYAACEEARDDAPEDIESALALAAREDGKRLLEGVFSNSPYLTQSLLREPAWLGQLAREGADALARSILSETRTQTSALTDEARIMRALRIAKRRLALTAALADIAGQWTLYQVTEALSDFADAAASAASGFVIRRAAERGAFRLKNPDDPERDSGFIVIGMGKLGARELNYSSDIDLICLYDNDVIDTDNPDGLQQHVIRMTRTLAKILDERTGDGYVFRVDLRLRPDPGSTPLAISVLAAETYYESLGQNWERAAMIKARPIAGDIAAAETFLHHLRPFVWRKSLDFAAIQDIHSIKRQIHAHKGGGKVAINGHDIKTGRGGIREIEFFAQTQQLIWGGREPSVRISRTIAAIRHLVDLGMVDADAADILNDAYEFLRRVEHRLQMQSDEQTQKLPDDDAGIAQLAAFCGYADAAGFRAALLGHLEAVEAQYGALFEDSPALTAEDGHAGNLAFTGADSDPETLKTLARFGFTDPALVDKSIRAWHHGRIRATRSTRARELLTELTPALLEAIGKQPDPDATFLRFDAFLASLPAGVQLFTMFQAYPDLLRLLSEIMGEAPRLAAHLSRRPNLLDSVLSADFYDPLPDLGELRTDCAEALTDAMFFEDILDATRRWNSDRRFQLGVQMLRGVTGAGDAALSFSNIADAVLQTLIPEVIREFEKAHGQIAGGMFCVLALGKLGSRELTPSSDLDLIFIYSADEADSHSDGARPLAVSQYYSRLGQRIINAVMSMTAEGTLYEIDMRLRPSGNKGPVATVLDGFERYYAETAWTWEHMALVRARIIFDTGVIGDKVQGMIRGTLTGSRDAAKTAAEVSNMRGRIEKQYATPCIWSIKQVAGGQVDVDFLAQYLVLIHAAAHPEIISADAAEVFRVAGDLGLINAGDATALRAAKSLYRDLQTFLALTIEGDMTDAKVAAFSEPLREDLCEITGSASFDALSEKLKNTEDAVRAIFVGLLGEPNADSEAAPPDI